MFKVAMPVELYSGGEVKAPSGLCAVDGIIGYLDAPEAFSSPDRVSAGLLWFTTGYVNYQFPNTARIAGKEVIELELQVELSSQVPGTSENWPSDISILVNVIEICTWTAPRDYADQRGKYTPNWWKPAGSQCAQLRAGPSKRR